MIQAVHRLLKQTWGYDHFRPLQREAIEAVLAGRDSLTVLPTGGGKSLCYQAPALARPGLALVVSPLISLMKDQVDALTEYGVPAARIDSTLENWEYFGVIDRIRSGELKLLYTSPERLAGGGSLLELLRQAGLAFIAIDEAHCISMWGHDFRPEYRALGGLRDLFPGVAIHAYTATATEPVRADIIKQLRLSAPEVLVGSFHRPNLVYRVERLGERKAQVAAILERYRGESGIIYCIRRADVESLCAELARDGWPVAPYHAGMEDGERRRNQEAFIQERVRTIVATVAFGMGIDKSNVRYVVHAGMPKSLENYQQESGRAGRDGLEAECTLLWSGSDYRLWKHIIEQGEPEGAPIHLRKLGVMYEYCQATRCRHGALLDYFGQRLGRPSCGACDVCLDGMELLPDTLVTSQKILSCIVRLDEARDSAWTIAVLQGATTLALTDAGHTALSTYGLLRDAPAERIREWIEQLAVQGFVKIRPEGLKVTERGWGALRGLETPRLLAPAVRPAASIERVRRAGVGRMDRPLYEALRELCRTIARSKGIPADAVFGDAALREMARRKPTTCRALRAIAGVGQRKEREYGQQFRSLIRLYAKDTAEVEF